MLAVVSRGKVGDVFSGHTRDRLYLGGRKLFVCRERAVFLGDLDFEIIYARAFSYIYRNSKRIIKTRVKKELASSSKQRRVSPRKYFKRKLLNSRRLRDLVYI